MPDLAKTIKDEIARIARREAKKEAAAPAKRAAELRRLVADLRRRVDRLEKDPAPESKTPEPPDPDKAERAWFTGAGVRALRQKLKLSQKELGRLCGVTPKAVISWEKTAGKIAMRTASKQALLGLRAMGARQAKETLEGMAG